MPTRALMPTCRPSNCWDLGHHSAQLTYVQQDGRRCAWTLRGALEQKIDENMPTRVLMMPTSQPTQCCMGAENPWEHVNMSADAYMPTKQLLGSGMPQCPTILCSAGWLEVCSDTPLCLAAEERAEIANTSADVAYTPNNTVVHGRRRFIVTHLHDP